MKSLDPLNMTAFASPLFALFCLGLLSLGACSQAENAVYVSPEGNDQGAGTRNDPFATLARAQQVATQVFSSPDEQTLTIWLAPGEYRINAPVVFAGAAFSKPGNQLFIKSREPGQAVLSGGKRLANWQKSSEGLWIAQLDGEVPGLTFVRELFLDGRRAPRARFPNEGYLRVKQVGQDKRTHFYFQPGDFPLPDQVSQTELILLHDWSVSRIPVREIDPATGKLTTVDSIGAKVLDFFTLDHWEQQPRYFLENDRQFIDRDFEWAFDAASQQIALRLPEGADPAQMDIVAPVSEGLLVLEGTEEQPVRNIQVEGIAFRHSAWNIPAKGYAGIQATFFDPRPNEGAGWYVVPAAVSARYADSCSFRNCRFEQLGGSGVWLGEGCTRNEISHSEFADISGNGIMIGEGQDRKVAGAPWWEKAPEQAAAHNTVRDCRIHDCGVQFFGAVGIWCGLAAGTSLADNEVYDLPYTGISVGWMWNPSPTPARDNRVSGNHIHHIMQTLSDGGGIYMLGLQPGSQLTDNLIHDVSVNVGRAESNGMFLDEGTTDLLVAENTIYHIAKSPIRFHKATTNLVRNNTLFCGEGIPAFTYNNCDETLIRKVDNHIYHPSDSGYAAALKKAEKR